MVNKFYVLVVEDTKDKKYVFDNQDEVNSFLSHWFKLYGSWDDHEGNWIEHIFHGCEYKIDINPRILVAKVERS